MHPVVENILYIAATVLLPLIPAFILYNVLPANRLDPDETTEVSGTYFHGLKIKLSGAFGGYFVLVVTVVAFINTHTPAITTVEAVTKPNIYTITGKVCYGPKASLEGKPPLINTQISLLPNDLVVNSDGTFSFDVPIKQNQYGEPIYPSLQLQIPNPDGNPGYQGIIHLAKDKQGFNEEAPDLLWDKYSITIKRPIVLRENAEVGKHFKKAIPTDSITDVSLAKEDQR
jgi:hypothetical protein